MKMKDPKLHSGDGTWACD